MGAFIARQPNGLLCRFSTTVDCPTHYNMTEEDYIELCKERAAEEARDVLKNYIRPFEWVKTYYAPNNMPEEIFNELLERMTEPVTREEENDHDREEDAGD